MADSLNTPTLPKLHSPLSRRAVLHHGLAASALAAVPVAAVAAPEPLRSPAERFYAKLEELKAIAKEYNPHIADWHVIQGLEDSQVADLVRAQKIDVLIAVRSMLFSLKNMCLRIE